MKRIFISLAIIIAVAAGAVGLTGAYFGDTETSTGNTFAAGAIDLLIDNSAWYNGEFIERLSWEMRDLTVEKFFDFNDFKPGDWEEDTISLHVEDNDAWLCMDVELTKDDDVSSTEPELGDGDAEEDPEDNFDGELANALHTVWWADDGDNVLETGENVFFEGTVSELDDANLALADTEGNIWNEEGGPALGGETHYIGKAFCFGELTQNPVTPGNNSPAVDPGILCNGSALDNTTQTDSTMGNLSFLAVQSRNNPSFVCGPGDIGCLDKADVMLVLDRSGSISSTSLAALKGAAKSFIDALTLSAGGVHAGFTSFATNGILNEHLTDDAVSIKTGIDALAAGGFTNLYEGLALANTELANPGDGHDRLDVESPDTIVVITDGSPNRPLPAGTADDIAAAEADAAKAAGATIYVVGVGTTAATETFLKTRIATSEAHYFSAADFDDLAEILGDIAACDD